APMRILLASADDSVYQSLEQHFTVCGLEPERTKDGVSTTLTLRKRSSDLRALILDWNLPGLDAEKLITQIRSRSDDDYLYILLIISREQWRAFHHLRYAVDGRLLIPFNAQDVESKLRTAARILKF